MPKALPSHTMNLSSCGPGANLKPNFIAGQDKSEIQRGSKKATPTKGGRNNTKQVNTNTKSGCPQACPSSIPRIQNPRSRSALSMRLNSEYGTAVASDTTAISSRSATSIGRSVILIARILVVHVILVEVGQGVEEAASGCIRALRAW